MSYSLNVICANEHDMELINLGKRGLFNKNQMCYNILNHSKGILLFNIASPFCYNIGFTMKNKLF